MKIYTTWPADKHGRPATTQGAWRQEKRWIVLDVTGGANNTRIVHGPVDRTAALAEELRLRMLEPLN